MMNGYIDGEPIGLQLNPGYHISDKVLAAGVFGSVQTRKRSYIVGTLDSVTHGNGHELMWGLVEKFTTPMNEAP